MYRLTALFAALAFALAALPARAFDTAAASAYVLDLTTGTVLMEKRADVALPPASMSKLMTVNMVFEALEDGRLTLDTRLRVSARAQGMGGSTMFLTTADRPTVDELLQGVIVQSGNDACVVLAEALGGTEDAFAQMMNERAQALGMQNATFANASGWPHPMHRMSMRDLGFLAARLISEFPQYYSYFGQEEFLFDGRAPENRRNRNPLLSLGIGADGLKTGHTQEAGYGLVGSALQGKRRVVFVISGMASEAERARESEAIVNWAFRQFTLKSPVKAGTRIAEANVFLGEVDKVGLVAAEDVSLLVPATQRDGLSAEITWTGPIEAPIAAGQEIALMTIRREGDLPEITVPLLAETAVAESGFLARFGAAFDQVVNLVRNRGAAPVATN